MKEQTIGEQRVRTSFNPSKDSEVEQIKQYSAELINLAIQQRELAQKLAIICASSLTKKDERLAYIAQNKYQHVSNEANRQADLVEEAAMWAVKAATA